MELAEAGVRVKDKTWFGRKEFLIKYETIPTSVSHITERSKTWFWLGLVSAPISLLVFAGNLLQGKHDLAFAFYLTFSLLFWFLSWQSHRKWVGFQCLDGSGLFFNCRQSLQGGGEGIYRAGSGSEGEVSAETFEGAVGGDIPVRERDVLDQDIRRPDEIESAGYYFGFCFSRLKKEMMDNFEHFTNEKHIDLPPLH